MLGRNTEILYQNKTRMNKNEQNDTHINENPTL